MSSLSVELDDNTGDDPSRRAALVVGRQDFASVTDAVCRVVERQEPPLGWWIAFTFAAAWTIVFFALIAYLIATGIGIWGNNIPVAWGFAITNFVFWIGIGHAGTLISAILFLFRQKWRTAINRAAEAMTIFAVICAGVFPAIHVGPRRGSSTGSRRIPTRCRSGRTSAVRSCGTCSPWARTSPCR